MRTILLSFAVLLSCITIKAQDTSKVYLTTGIGIISTPGKLNRVFQPSFAFNSGIEINLPKKYFFQVELDLNSLQYNQQVKSMTQEYLFRNTNSNVFMVGINAGKNIGKLNGKFFTSIYTGIGYLSIAEPRVLVNDLDFTVNQSVVRQRSIFGKIGGRLAYRTKSPFFSNYLSRCVPFGIAIDSAIATV